MKNLLEEIEKEHEELNGRIIERRAFLIKEETLETNLLSVSEYEDMVIILNDMCALRQSLASMLFLLRDKKQD